MNYDFDEVIDRTHVCQQALSYQQGVVRGSFGNKKVEIKEGFSLIPMWVADMSFKTAPCVIEALKKRLETPTFGYFYQDDTYYDAISDWQATRHGLDGVKKEHIGYDNGIVGGIINALLFQGLENEPVLINSPSYIGFIRAAKAAKRPLIFSDLVKDDQGVWRMDFNDMEEKIKQHNIKTMIFCSPHNPSGRVWEKCELEELADLAKKYDLTVIDDEIWSDIILDHHQHTSLLSVNDDIKNRTIYFSAVSKTFSLPGLTGSYDIVYNPILKKEFDEFKQSRGFNSANALSTQALCGAYTTEGKQWVDDLCDVLSRNIHYAFDHIQQFDGIETTLPQGTYILLLDCTKWCENHHATVDDLLAKGIEVGVLWQDGRPFHQENTIRMNCSLPMPLLKEAFERLEKYVFND